MTSGLLQFLIGIPLLLIFVCLLIAFLNYRYNPIWRKSQLDKLEVNDYLWCKGSPKWGIGHRVAVVKSIDKKKKKIVYDEWGRTEEGWKQLQDKVENSVKEFFMLVNGEPAHWVEPSEEN